MHCGGGLLPQLDDLLPHSRLSDGGLLRGDGLPQVGDGRPCDGLGLSRLAQLLAANNLLRCWGCRACCCCCSGDWWHAQPPQCLSHCVAPGTAGGHAAAADVAAAAAAALDVVNRTAVGRHHVAAGAATAAGGGGTAGARAGWQGQDTPLKQVPHLIAQIHLQRPGEALAVAGVDKERTVSFRRVIIIIAAAAVVVVNDDCC